jgi:F-type H+-transporting ATPase subunit delta
MRQPKVAQRYAKALFDLAVETNQLEKVKSDLDTVRGVNSEELLMVFRSPVINEDKKISIFESIFSDKVTQLTSAFFKLVFRKGRTIALPEILDAFFAMYRHHHRIRVIEVTTAIPVEADTLQFIKERMLKLPRFKDAELQMQSKVDEDIIGGFVLQADDVLYDASIRHDLMVIKKQFIENMYVQKLR